MALAASRTHGNVTELKRHPSETKTLRGVGGVAAAASSQVPPCKTIFGIHLYFARHAFVVAGRAASNALD